MADEQLRKEVMANIIEWMTAVPEGIDPYTAALKQYPDVPDMVLATASMELEMQREEKWWQSMEKTIDGEIVRAALLSGSQS